MPVGDVVPEIALIVGAAACLVHAIIAPRTRQARGAPIALAALAASGGLAITVALREAQRLTFSGTWALDGAGLGATLVILAATALVVGLTPEWLRADARHGEYYAILLFAALGAVMIARAADVMEIVVGVLLSSITGYALAAYHRSSARSVEAGLKYFLLGGLANAALVLGAVILFGLVGTTLLAEAPAALSDAAAPGLVAVVALIGVGLAFKLGAVPAHAWMPDVAQGAPAPSAAFLTVVPKAGALVALARVVDVLPAGAVGWRPAVAAMAAATMTVGNLGALRQDDVRRLLGWSAVSQSGYALMAVAALGRSDLAVPALVLFLAAYAAANVCAFAVVAELRGITALRDYRGLGRARPWLGAALALALLSLVGVPPLAGFAGKLVLFTATIEAGYAWLAALAVLNTVASLYYYLRVLGPAYLDTAPTPAPEPFPLLGRAAYATVAAAALLTVAVGVGAQPLLGPLADARLLP